MDCSNVDVVSVNTEMNFPYIVMIELLCKMNEILMFWQINEVFCFISLLHKAHISSVRKICEVVVLNLLLVKHFY